MPASDGEEQSHREQAAQLLNTRIEQVSLSSEVIAREGRRWKM